VNLAIINIGKASERSGIGFSNFYIAYLKYKDFEEPDTPSMYQSWDYTKTNKGKFKNIYRFIASNPFMMNEFDYYWFPDPDLELVNSNMMDFIKLNNLDLCQPSLTKDSEASHSFLITQGNGIRKVPFVEGQCPIFSRKALQKNLWTFDLNWSSFGIDLLWGKDNECFVLDDFTVRHPHGPRYREKIKGLGFPDPMQELGEIKARFGV
jgi:hypothetical protein